MAESEILEETTTENTADYDCSSQVNVDHRNSSGVFPTASLLLECARDEYNKERERMYSLDNKASFFMSAIILVATIFMPFIPFRNIREILSNGTDLKKAATYVTGTLIVVALVFLITAFKHLYDAYRIKGFNRFNIDNLTDTYILMSDRNSSEKALCENYKNTIEKNIKNNDEKAEQISHGIKSCAIGFLILTISAIVMVCFIG